ncbi:transposase [Vibrio parahaemolyticus]|nr:transposase [Vibrio parahaemolyticus]MDG2932859.1 transposase [Vibrio parahaemolyticus]
MKLFLVKLPNQSRSESDLDDNFGYEKHATKLSPNSRNGYSSKSILTDDGEVPIDVLCDQDANFEPKLVRKYQTRFQPKTKTEYEALLALEMFSDK